MVFYDREILNGLEKIPTPNCPGSLVVTGESQAVLTGEKPGQTIIAACVYGKGRILVTSHDCYLNWLCNPSTESQEKLNRNIKIWLTGENVDESEIVDFGEASKSEKRFINYKLIKWHHDFDPSEEDEQKLLKWLKIGGGLICGSTAWGYLQIYSNKTLNDMSLFRFLKKYTGIILTPDILSFPDEIDVSKNRAKHSHFDYAFEKVTSNPDKLDKYSCTIDYGLESMAKEGLLQEEKIKDLKQMVIEKCLNVVPKEDKPIKEADKKVALKLLGKCLNCVEGEKAPGVDDFPGDFDELPELLQNVEIIVETNFEEWVSTGYYLPAGICLNVEVIDGDISGWSIRIGAHSDDIGECDVLMRWPCVTVVKPLKESITFKSSFGGLVYFQSPGAGSLSVILSNVIRSPYIDLTKPETIENWIDNRNSPGLWAELAGKNIIFTTPSYCIRHIENPIEILKFWDKVVESHHKCRGTHVKNYKRERVVNDRQPSAGYMHSGYPIVTHLDCCQRDHEECIFDLEKLSKNGNWGLFHELGHNMQRDEWTFEGTVEVTVNIFSLHATYQLIGQNILDQKWPRGLITQFHRYFSKQPTYEDFQNDCGMALMLFVQLIKHFGWSSMYTFMKNYEADITFNNNLPQSEQEKIDQWVIRYSKIVSRNLKPQFEMFGLPVSESVNEKLIELEPWCPEEEKDSNIFFTKLA